MAEGMVPMNRSRQLGDIIDLDMLQYIQDNFAKAMGLAFITVDYKGRPVTKASGFSAFCNKTREKIGFQELCAQCDAHGGLHAAITGQPYVYRCHADLVDFAVPLILEDSYMGAVLGGQANLPAGDEEQLDWIVPQQTGWQKDPELLALRKNITTISYDKLMAVVTLLRNMIQYLLEEEYKQIFSKELEEKRRALIEEKTDLSRKLEEKHRELMEEKAHRLDLEETVQKRELDAIQNQLGFDFFFYMLNVIAKLAYQEKAPRTEEAVYDFADMMRYALGNSNNKIVSLGEELRYVEHLLHVQKTQSGEGLTYEIHVPEEFEGVACPFMLLQPIVENAIKYTLTENGESGLIRITGQRDGEDVVLSVSDNGVGMRKEQIEAILDPEVYREKGNGKLTLYNMNQKLKAYFGSSYGLVIESETSGEHGTQVRIRLPIRAVI